MNITDPAAHDAPNSTAPVKAADTPSALRAAALRPADVTDVTWRRRFLYGFLTGEGCGGTDSAGVFAADVPRTRADVEALRSRLDDIELGPRHAVSAVPLPDRRHWDATVGELWDAYEDAEARRRDLRQTAVARAEVETAAELAAFGLDPLDGLDVEFHGWEFGGDDPHLPMAVIVNHHCRCACGGAYYDYDDIADDDEADRRVSAATPAGSWVGSLPDGRVVLSTSEERPDSETFTAAVTEASDAFDEVVTAAVADAESRAAAVLSSEQVAALTVAEFEAYLDRLGIKFWGRRIELRPSDDRLPSPAPFDADEVARVARRAFAGRLAADGFWVSNLT